LQNSCNSCAFKKIIVSDSFTPHHQFSRFVYGQEKDFKSTAFGVKIYKLAQEMQIDTLSDELDEFFKQTKSSEIFALFDLYHSTGNQAGLDNCKSVSKGLCQYIFNIESIFYNCH
jgi:hypothetical protein